MVNIGQGWADLGCVVSYLSHKGFSSSVSDLYVENGANTVVPKGPLAFRLGELQMVRNALSKYPPDIAILALPDSELKVLTGLALYIRGSKVIFDYGGMWQSLMFRADDRAKSLQDQFLLLGLNGSEDALALATSRLPNIISAPTKTLANFLSKFLVRKTQVVYHPIDIGLSSSLEEQSHRLPPELADAKRSQRLILTIAKGDDPLSYLVPQLTKVLVRRGAMLVVIGDCPVTMELVRKRDWGSHYYFVQRVVHPELARWIHSSEFGLSLNPSGLRHQAIVPCGLSRIAEHFAMGKPVISDSFSAKEYVTDGVTGYTAKSLDELLSRTDFLLADDAMLAEMGSNARIFAARNFDNRIIAKQLLDLLGV